MQYQKSLYGLKQSPWVYFGKFTKSMIRNGYKQSQGVHTLFIKHSSQGKVTTLIVYADDIVVTRDDLEEVGRLRAYLANKFEIKDLESLIYFLGIEVARSKQCIFISQWKYVLDMLKEVGLLDCKHVETPIEANHKLEEQNEEPAGCS